MAGEFIYTSEYLNTLQAVNDVSYIFPNDQKIYTYDVEGGGTQGWTANISWITLVVDKISYDRVELPDFSNSEIIGYFTNSSGSANEYSNGVIRIPSFMYNGPILPASDVNVPVTLVNITWVKDGIDYSRNIAFIQQWEPGVEIADPVNDNYFEPVFPIASTLTLSGPTETILEDPFTLVAQSNIPIDLGLTNPCSFYWINSGTEVLLGTNNFVGKVASLEVFPNNFSIPIGVQQFVAKFGGRRFYGAVTSNIHTLEIKDGIPLLVVSSQTVPDDPWYPNINVVNTLTVQSDPAFTQTGVTILNTLSVKLVQGFPPYTEWLVENDNFDGYSASGNYFGVNYSTFLTSATMVDTALANTGTYWTITTSTQNTTTYTATIYVENTLSMVTAWKSQVVGRYGSGSYTENFRVANTTTRTVNAADFAITINQDSVNTLEEEGFNVSIRTTSSPYANNITLVARLNGANTQTLYSANASGTSTIVVPVTTLSTGTWTLQASYPGDIGNNIYYANKAASSNTLTHVIRTGNELGAKFIYFNTGTYDVLRVWATTSTTLTQTVSFYNSSTLLSTASWSRQIIDLIDPETTVLKTSATYTIINFAQNFSSNAGLGIGWSSPNNDNNTDLTVLGTGNINFQPDPANLYNTTANFPSPKAVNKFTLFKYDDGTNYSLVELTGTNYSAVSDPVTYDNIWFSDVIGTEQFNLNEPFINTNTTFYNYIESRFGYTYMLAYLDSLRTLDGSPFKLNGIFYPGRPPEAIPVPPPVVVNPFNSDRLKYSNINRVWFYAPASTSRITPETYIKNYAPTGYAFFDGDLRITNEKACILEIFSYNQPNGTQYYWSVDTPAGCWVQGNSGVVTLQDNYATINLEANYTLPAGINDLKFKFTVRKDSPTGPIIDGFQNPSTLDDNPVRPFTFTANVSSQYYGNSVTISIRDWSILNFGSLTTNTTENILAYWDCPTPDRTRTFDFVLPVTVVNGNADVTLTVPTQLWEFDRPLYFYWRGRRARVVFTKKPVVIETAAGVIQTVEKKLYDSYRTAEVGDTRGYNVIALSTNGAPLDVSESDPRRLYWIGTDNQEYYIDLVEYIGDASWLKPIENLQQKSGTQARSVVNARFYRFTPEIPQANTSFRTAYEMSSVLDLDPNNNWIPRPLPGYPNESFWRDVNFLNAEKGWYVSKPSPQNFSYYQNFANKLWVSANSTDPEENAKANFYNQWFRAFTNPNKQTYVKTVFTTTFDIIQTEDVQSATALLPIGTITTTTDLRATWPGTRFLDPIYGRFNPFDIKLSPAYTNVFLDVWNINTATQKTTATQVYSTNQVLLQAQVVSEGPNINQNTGTVTFYNNDNNAIFTTTNVVDGEANAYVYADNLTSLTTAPFINIRARYDVPSQESIYSDIENVQVLRSSGYSSANFVGQSVPRFTAISRQSVTNFGRTLTLNGRIDIIAPFFNAANAGTANLTVVARIAAQGANIYEPPLSGGANWSSPDLPLIIPATGKDTYVLTRPAIQTAPNMFSLVWTGQAVLNVGPSRNIRSYSIALLVSADGAIPPDSRILWKANFT